MQVKQQSCIRLIYPFLFEAAEFPQRVATADEFEWRDLGRLWKRRSFSDRELLPHVARFLNPPAGEVPTAVFWCVADKALQSRKGLGGGAKNKAVQWWFVRGRASASQQDDLDRRDGTPGTRFQLADCQLALFHAGVGFLSLCLRPEVVDERQWLDFLHDARFLRWKQTSITARRREFDHIADEAVEKEYFPDLAAPAPDPQAPRCLEDLVFGLLHTVAGGRDQPRWWSDVYLRHQAIPYAALFVDGAADRQQRQQVLFRLHNFFRSTQGTNPAPEELSTDQPHLLPYAEGQWFVFSFDGASFAAFDPPPTPFFQHTLPAHLDGEYLLLFLMALHQRFALMGLSEQVSTRWLQQHGDDGEGREAAFRAIRDGLLSFTARGYFSQVMQRRHHHRCYQRWQETFEVERLYREVSDEVREMYHCLQMDTAQRLEELAEADRRQSARTERTLNLLATLLLMPALALSLVGATNNESWLVAGAALAIGLLSGYLVLSVSARWQESADRPDERSQ